jgi:dTMP kinase
MKRARRRIPGLFITLEGIEGAGKSTHLPFLADLFRRRGRKVVVTREPGGTRLGDEIRELLLFRSLGHPLHPRAELMLIFCARLQHLEEVIRPALAAGRVVICDRFTDSTYAYQGGGHGIDAREIRVLEKWVQQGLRPQRTLLFDLPVPTALERAGRRNRDGGRGTDRFESKTVSFFRRVRRAYLDIAAREPRRVRVIDARAPVEAIQARLAALLEQERWI